MSEPEVIAVGTTCPICGETFYVPEPKYSELIQQLVRVARAAKPVMDSYYDTENVPNEEIYPWMRDLVDALSALPEGMLDE